MSKNRLDPSKVEIIRNALTSIAMEMKATVIRSAFSTTIQEAQDFSVALFETDRMLAQSDTIALHMGSCNSRIKAMLRKFPPERLEHGDVILWNDPYWGGSHTPDVTTVRVIKVGELIFLPIALGHWSDVGGMTPGSISGGVTELYQEGILIPPIKLYEKGKFNEAVMDIVLNNVRIPFLRAGDTRTQVAACDLVEERLTELVDRFGLEMLRDSIEEILNATEKRLRARITDIPDGIYEYEDYLDSDGHLDEPIRIHVKITVEGSNIKVDFSGTSQQTIGPTNCSTGVVLSAVYCMLKPMLDPFWVINDGFYRPIEVVIPEGTCLNPDRPAPTGGCWEIATRVSDVVLGALADVAPRYGAPCNGSASHTFIGGVHPKTGRPYVWYEYPVGGYGASPNIDGCNSVSTIRGGDVRDYPVERAEAEFPLLCTLYRQRVDSGGPGEFRGGLGLVRNMKILDDGRYKKIGVSTIWDRTKIPAYGIKGGFTACPGRVAVIRADGGREYVSVELGTKCSLLPLHENDTLSCRTGGGGGFGDPLERDPELVLRDLREEKITNTVAVDIYGVIVDRKNWRVNTGATRKQRDRIGKARIYCQVTGKEVDFMGNRRLIRVHPQLLKLLDLSTGQLIEVVGKASAPLRGWAVADEGYSLGDIGLDETSLRILKVNIGHRVWVRDPNWAIRYVITREEVEL